MTEQGAQANSSAEHLPVLLEESVKALAIKPDGIYLDGTFGRGGHSKAILQQLGPDGRLLAVDKDPEAIRTAQVQFGDDGRFEIVRGSFTMLEQEVKQRGWTGKVNGILLDLGVSSPQLDDADRGFSFRADGPLDMRMDPESGISAADWLAEASDSDIAVVLKEYGEERYAKRIARAIVESRVQDGPILTTGRLAKVVTDANPRWEKNKDPATRSFQGIRIYINRELADLDDVLAQVLNILTPGGRLAVISFHSLEDRRVKQFMRREARGGEFPPDLPVTQAQFKPNIRLVGKAVRAGEAELAVNPRARSAVLRIAERMQ